MDLNQTQIAEFQTLYHKHFGESISLQEAEEKGKAVIELVQFVLTKSDENYDQ